MNFNNVTDQQITAQLVKVFGNPERLAEYEKQNEIYEGFCGWCGAMAPLSRPAFVKQFSEARTAAAEMQAHTILQDNANSYENSNHAAHTREAEKHEAEGSKAPKAGAFVFAVHSGLKCDDGRGVYGEIESILNYCNAKSLCKVKEVFEVSAAEFARPQLADELVYNYKPAHEFPGGADNDDPERRDILNEYRYYYTETAAVVCRESGKWFLIDSEGYDYARYILLPMNWREALAAEVQEEERRKAEKEEADRREEECREAEELANYKARCEKWAKYMQDIRPLEKAFKAAKYGTAEYKRASRKLQDTRRANIKAMILHAFPGLKLSIRQHSGWGSAYEIEYFDGPTIEKFNAATDLNLFVFGHDTFDGMTDCAGYEHEKHTDFAAVYMGEIWGDIRASREQTDENRAAMVADIVAIVPEAKAERYTFKSEEIRAIAEKFSVDYWSLQSVADRMGNWGNAETLAHNIFCALDFETKATADTTTENAAEEAAESTEAPAKGLSLVEIAGGVAVEGDCRTTYKNRKEIKAHGAQWNKEAKRWEATDAEGVKNLRNWFNMEG